MTGLDALEFIACGATAVAVGAANFTGLEAPRRILDELRAECAARGFARAAAARGLALRALTPERDRPQRAGKVPASRRELRPGRRLLNRAARFTYTRARCPPPRSSSTRPPSVRSTSAWTRSRAPTRCAAGARRSRPTSSAAPSSIRDVLAAPPDFLLTAKVVDLLMAAPKCGRVKSAKIMEQCRISPSKTVGGLSERQRAELLAYFGG